MSEIIGVNIKKRGYAYIFVYSAHVRPAVNTNQRAKTKIYTLRKHTPGTPKPNISTQNPFGLFQ